MEIPTWLYRALRNSGVIMSLRLQFVCMVASEPVLYNAWSQDLRLNNFGRACQSTICWQHLPKCFSRLPFAQISDTAGYIDNRFEGSDLLNILATQITTIVMVELQHTHSINTGV
jgi:hypothetical protein